VLDEIDALDLMKKDAAERLAQEVKNPKKLKYMQFMAKLSPVLT